MNCTAVLKYAIEALKIEHVIVCGHYGCGGVEAALGEGLHGPVCQVAAVREAWQRGQPLMVHGWIYDLRDGLLRDLNATVCRRRANLPACGASMNRAVVQC